MALNRYYNPETFEYQNNPYEQTNGRSAGTIPNVAQQQIGANIAGGVTDIASTAIGAGFQSRAIRDAASESKELAEQSRRDKLKQENISFSLKERIHRQDVKRFELQKIQERETLRHSTWLSEFQKAIENDKELHRIVDNIFTSANKSEQIKNVILSSFRKRQ